ncbi:DUF6193 family natural product biosynthesis protein [Actinacidiphila glaucinigra]|uniref:DUF6193 family natural product biosynthesis protein n=1 Tax=Actinacidiphila glaucinigra TaxID=235986 RepID=UPI0035E0D5A1
MAPQHDPAEPPPDIAGRAGLAAALRAEAEEGGFLLPVTSPSGDPLTGAAVGSRLPHRSALQVNAAESGREWWIRGADTSQGMPLVEGLARELGQLVRAARAWHEGASLSDIRRAAPFVRLTDRFEVPDGDPALLAESEWRGLRNEARTVVVPGYRALVEEAYAVPALRALYPFRIGWALCFSTTTRPDLTVTGPRLRAYDTDEFTVTEDLVGGGVLAVTATAREAVAVAVRRLPGGLGPVRSGASG